MKVQPKRRTEGRAARAARTLGGFVLRTATSSATSRAHGEHRGFSPVAEAFQRADTDGFVLRVPRLGSSGGEVVLNVVPGRTKAGESLQGVDAINQISVLATDAEGADPTGVVWSRSADNAGLWVPATQGGSDEVVGGRISEAYEGMKQQRGEPSAGTPGLQARMPDYTVNGLGPDALIRHLTQSV